MKGSVSMRLICSWRQRQLAHHAVLYAPLPPRSLLAQHLARCPQCSEAYRDMIRLQQEVLKRLPAPTLSPDFDANIMARFATESRGASLPRLPAAFPIYPGLRPLALGTAMVILASV